MTLEPHNQRWILALDAPVQLPEALKASNILAVTQRQPVTEAAALRTGSQSRLPFQRR